MKAMGSLVQFFMVYLCVEEVPMQTGLKYRLPSPSKSKRRDSAQLRSMISCGVQRKTIDVVQKSQPTFGWNLKRVASSRMESRTNGLKKDGKDPGLSSEHRIILSKRQRHKETRYRVSGTMSIFHQQCGWRTEKKMCTMEEIILRSLSFPLLTLVYTG